MSEHEATFKYKLDFYYQSALIYLVTLILYGGIRGNFVERKFEYVLNDPLMYVIIFFVLMSIGALALNALRNRRLQDMEWMYIGREARVRTSGRFQVVMFKLRNRRRIVRIRVGRYEREKELVAQMQRLATMVPRRKTPRWRRPRITDR
jgi:hypothetical protein